MVVDYAHTDDALRNLTALAREFVQQAGEKGRVITVFGCGGDRDRAKRPLMGEAAGRGSDFVVLTSDNPRSEDPLAIINDAMVGLQRPGRSTRWNGTAKMAIALAIREAGPGDIVLLAGKGHEKVQITREGAIPFDDVEVARQVLREAGYDCGQLQASLDMKLPLARIAGVPGRQLANLIPNALAQGYSIDSRTIRPGELFFAVKGREFRWPRLCRASVGQRESRQSCERTSLRDTRTKRT